ncbi:hypothetical protein [Streptomyces sp. KL116D]|uniref:hypothetical protein n=1 Tax=Streptomyces sp. KL116D TaxID=3045152 RepID=UPI003558C871
MPRPLEVAGRAGRPADDFAEPWARRWQAVAVPHVQSRSRPWQVVGGPAQGALDEDASPRSNQPTHASPRSCGASVPVAIARQVAQ